MFEIFSLCGHGVHECLRTCHDLSRGFGGRGEGMLKGACFVSKSANAYCTTITVRQMRGKVFIHFFPAVSNARGPNFKLLFLGGPRDRRLHVANSFHSPLFTLQHTTILLSVFLLYFFMTFRAPVPCADLDTRCRPEHRELEHHHIDVFFGWTRGAVYSC